MVQVKICGITTYEDAHYSAEVGANMLGFNFVKQSPRYIEPKAATEICDKLRTEFGAACPVLVGIFVNDGVGKISQITNEVGLDAAQLSGDESDSMLVELRGLGYKGIQPMNRAMALEDVNYYEKTFPQNAKLPSILVDAYHPNLRGGTGDQTSDAVATAVREAVPRMMLAGGLKPDNVAERITAIRPWGVDVASGVEVDGQPGVKDHHKLKTFIEAAQFA